MQNQKGELSDDNFTILQENRFDRRDVLQVGASALASGLAGCTGAVGGDDTFQIGINMELSSGYGLQGGSVVNAVELRANEINENGGLDGEEIELVVEDNQVDPGVAVEKARKLTRDDSVDVMLGPINSSQRVAISEVAQQEEVPLIYPIPYEGPVADDYCNEWMFKTWQVPSQQVIPFIPWLMDNYGDRFFFLGADYSWPRALNDIAKETVAEHGGETVGEEYVQINATDFSSIIPRVEEADPDVLFMDLVGESVTAIQDQMHNRGVRDQWQEVGLAHGIAELAGVSAGAAEGVLNCQGYYAMLPNEENQTFVQSYTDEYGDGNEEDVFINYLTGPSYIAIQLLEQAVEEAGGTSTEDIREGFPETSLENTIAGPLSMEHDYQAQVQCKVAQVNSETDYELQDTLDAVMPPETCDNI